MTARRRSVLISLIVALAGSAGILTVPLHAGGAAAIGLVARSVGATNAGQQVRSNTALFDGDSFRVRDDGIAVVQLKNGSRVVLGRQTVASFTQEPNSVTVRLEEGNVSLFHPLRGQALKVKAGDVLVEPASGYPTLGEVALLDGVLSVRAQDGRLRLKGRGLALEATKGKPIILTKTARSPGAGPGAAAAGRSLGKTVGLAAAGTGASVGVAAALTKEKNPTAIEKVAAHVPEEACEHAASPSVPAVACADR